MLQCDVCKKWTSEPMKRYDVKKDESLLVCEECADEIEFRNKTWAKARLISCVGVAFAAVVIIFILAVVMVN